MITHLTTKPAVSCLYMAERTGSLTFTRPVSRISLRFTEGCAIPEERDITWV